MKSLSVCSKSRSVLCKNRFKREVLLPEKEARSRIKNKEMVLVSGLDEAEADSATDKKKEKLKNLEADVKEAKAEADAAKAEVEALKAELDDLKAEKDTSE